MNVERATLGPWFSAADNSSMDFFCFVQHRYYGKSMPYGTMEASYKDADTLSTLTSEQALADFATLVTDLKRNLSAEASPVILFGGSYGGSMLCFFF
jgi:hypothetical protein